MMKRALIVAHVASMIDLFNKDNIKILTEMGYKVDVACNFLKGNVSSTSRINKFCEEMGKAGIGLYQIPIPRNIMALKDLINAYINIKKLVNKNNYDVVHCQSPIGGVIARLACRKKRKSGTKIIYMAHGFHFYHGAPFKNWVIYYPIEKFCAKYTDCIITVNKEDYLLASSKLKKTKKVAYVPGVGIDLDAINRRCQHKNEIRQLYNIPSKAMVIVSVGELNKNKNHEVVIKAIALLNDNNIYYLICGQGPLLEPLKSLASDLGMSNRVMFLGYRDDVIEINAMSDIFVFPSLREGLPVSLMEAMACGLPVVCSNIRGNNDLIKDRLGGYLIDTNNSQEYAKSLHKLIKEPEIRNNMKSYNLNVIRGYGIVKVNKLMKEIYVNL